MKIKYGKVYLPHINYTVTFKPYKPPPDSIPLARQSANSVTLAPHHKVWLQSHPHRTQRWLRDRIADGFDVHHMDGDDENDHPSNLILLETTDHTRTIHTLPLSRLDAVKAVQERVARLDAAFAAAGVERGAYVSKTIKGRTYWYFQDAKTRKQHYIGPEFPYLLLVIQGYNEEKQAILKSVA